ncbi:Gfo/Idh/MocA family oxidoreductase [Gammaproteobacteria bacterium]|nr:Gfo/Idh/MocA family oxidoreductase [Gammaproteobacteria bacterium]
MIGCGSVAETKSGPAFYTCSGSQLTYVMSNNAEKTKAFAERHNIDNWTVDYHELLNSNLVDAVYVATPPDSHVFYGKLAADAGKPVLVEKPLSQSLAEAEALVTYCSKKNVPLYVAYYRRGLPRFLKVKEMLDEGVIGKVRFVHVQHTESPEEHGVSPIDSTNIPLRQDLPWRFKPEISGGGNFVDCGTHMIDMLDFLLGPITQLRGNAINVGGIYPAEDSVCASFMIGDDILGSGEWNYVCGKKTDRLEIVGSVGSIRISSFDDKPIELWVDGNLEMIEARNPEYWSQPFIQTVVDAISGKGECNSGGDNALRAMRCQEVLLADYYAIS